MTSPRRWTVLVPLRDLGGGKTRLAGVLTAPERAELTRFSANAVVAACLATPSVARVVVVAGSDEAAAWAHACGAVPWMQPSGSSSLSGAMEAAVSAHLTQEEGLALVMGDLPRASSLAVQRCLSKAESRAVSLVPSRSGSGTNLLAFTGARAISLSLGSEQSLALHREAARRARLPVQTVRSADLALDVDEASDLALLARYPAMRAAMPFLNRF